MAKVSCIIPSFNKPKYVQEAIESVLNQTFQDFELVIVENSIDPEVKELVSKYTTNPKVVMVDYIFTEKEREDQYPTAVILNEWLDKMNGEYIFYLSDDDLFAPDCFEQVVNYMDAHPDYSVCYFSMKSIRGNGENWADDGERRATMDWGQGTNLDCVLDGGQVAFRKSVLKSLEKPYFVTDWLNAGHCDGLFLNKLCSQFAVWPIDSYLLTHRTTEVSTHANR